MLCYLILTYLGIAVVMLFAYYLARSEAETSTYLVDANESPESMREYLHILANDLSDIDLPVAVTAMREIFTHHDDDHDDDGDYDDGYFIDDKTATFAARYRLS